MEELEYFYNFHRYGGLFLEEEDYKYINECDYTEDLLGIFDAIDQDDIAKWVPVEQLETSKIVSTDGAIVLVLKKLTL